MRVVGGGAGVSESKKKKDGQTNRPKPICTRSFNFRRSWGHNSAYSKCTSYVPDKFISFDLQE